MVTGEPVVDRPVEQEVAITEDNPDDPTTWGFRPADLVVEAGTTIVWRNNGKSAHTVTADDGSFDSGEIQPGATWKQRFDVPGAFAYHCTPHPWMKASIRVVAPGAEAPPPSAPDDKKPVSGEGHRLSSPSPQRERTGRGPVRHEVAIVEPDPAKPFGWGFEPATLDVQAGDTVVWRNAGSVEHSVVAEAFDSGLLKPGATWERTFDTVGVFAYKCGPHPWMKGAIRVAAADGEPRLPCRSTITQWPRGPHLGRALPGPARRSRRRRGPSATTSTSSSPTSPWRWSGTSTRPRTCGWATRSSGRTRGTSSTASPEAASTRGFSIPGPGGSAASTSPVSTPTTALPTRG